MKLKKLKRSYSLLVIGGLIISTNSFSSQAHASESLSLSLGGTFSECKSLTSKPGTHCQTKLLDPTTIDIPLAPFSGAPAGTPIQIGQWSQRMIINGVEYRVDIVVTKLFLANGNPLWYLDVAQGWEAGNPLRSSIKLHSSTPSTMGDFEFTGAPTTVATESESNRMQFTLMVSSISVK